MGSFKKMKGPLAQRAGSCDRFRRQAWRRGDAHSPNQPPLRNLTEIPGRPAGKTPLTERVFRLTADGSKAGRLARSGERYGSYAQAVIQQCTLAHVVADFNH